MSNNQYYEDSHNMHMALIRAIYRVMGKPLPEPSPEPAPEPPPEPPIAEPIDEAEAAYQALVAQIAKFKYIRGWYISHTDRTMIETRCDVPIDNAEQPPYSASVCWAMTLTEFIKYHTPIEERQARYEAEWRPADWRPADSSTTKRRPYTPMSLKYIAQELDKQGYDFIPGAFLAIKRTGMWETAISKEQS